jgi:hypothetical protein
MNNIGEFLNGNWPACKIAPHGTHVKVDGMGVKKPYCLHCGEVLTKVRKRNNN